jgi:hypothetical protein
MTPRVALRCAVMDDTPRFVEILSNWNVIRMVRLARIPAPRQWLARGLQRMRASAPPARHSVSWSIPRGMEIDQYRYELRCADWTEAAG